VNIISTVFDLAIKEKSTNAQAAKKLGLSIRQIQRILPSAKKAEARLFMS
jgi:hypothetical protein